MLLEPEEWPALYCITHQTVTSPPTPPMLAEVVAWPARLGGISPDDTAVPPGPIVVWRGLQQLSALTAMSGLLTPHLQRPPPSDIPTVA